MINTVGYNPVKYCGPGVINLLLQCVNKRKLFILRYERNLTFKFSLHSCELDIFIKLIVLLKLAAFGNLFLNPYPANTESD